MNRRQFTASLGAAGSAAVLPFSAMPSVAATVPAVPASTYSWAQLIVRAQSKANPAMLARMLRLSPDMADVVFETLIRDGVLRAPSAVGVAQAVRPIHATGHSGATSQALRQNITAAWDHITQDAKPLVNDIDPALGCRDNIIEDASDARTSKPLQESPQSG